MGTAFPETMIPPTAGISAVSRLGLPIASPWRMMIVAGAAISPASRRYPPNAAARPARSYNPLMQLQEVPMSDTVRKANYAYLTTTSKPGEAAHILEALRTANVYLHAFSGFPQGRNKAQIDLVTDDLDALKAAARRERWKLSRIKRVFLMQGADRVGAVVPPLARLGRANINIVAAHAIAAGEGRFGMIFWVAPRDYNRAAKLLDAI
jgi:hypothetical protein